MYQAKNSKLIPMTIFWEFKGWDYASAIFNRWCLLPVMACETRMFEKFLINLNIWVKALIMTGMKIGFPESASHLRL